MLRPRCAENDRLRGDDDPCTNQAAATHLLAASLSGTPAEQIEYHGQADLRSRLSQIN
jgi:hypothetical protein